MTLMQRLFTIGLGGLLLSGLSLISASAEFVPALALPPPNDVPEEVLRTEIIVEARSPLDGQPLTAAEYAELQAQLQTAPYPPTLDSKIQNQFTLLYLRRAIRIFLPFVLR
jgi:hypothetical protein